MAKEVALKITYSQAPGIKKPSVEKLHQDIKEAGYGFFQNNPEYGPSFLLFASGIRSAQLEEEIRKALEKGFDAENAPVLEDLNLRLKTFEEENRILYADIQESYPEGSTQVELSEFREEPDYISLKPSADSSNYELSPNTSYGSLGVDVGPAKDMASLALGQITGNVKKRIAEKVAAKVVTTVATKAGAHVVTQTVGSSLPVIGNIIAFIVVTFASGFVDRMLISIKKKTKDLEEALGGGILALINSVGGFFSFLGALVGFTFAAISLPVVIAFVSIPIIIVIILFIINSGAYLVPPTLQTALGITNPYIDIRKTADSTEFYNSDLPVTVTYTIEIEARKGTLTNISFRSECQVIRRSGTSACPSSSAPRNIMVNGQPSPTFPPTPPQIISPAGEPYTIIYQQVFSGSSFQDSLVTDTFTITADAPEQANNEAAASAGIRIGNPPDECPSGWPILPTSSEGSLVIIQGPHGRFTHALGPGIEAIDIMASPDHQITARHTGVAQAGPGGFYGDSIRVASNCGGRTFSSIYAHMASIDINPGDFVVFGQTIGKSGYSGTIPSNAHLHYEFSPSNSGMPMAPPYIPKSVRYGCYYLDPCNATVP